MENIYPKEESILLEQVGVMLILLQDLEGFFSQFLKLCLPGSKGINVKKLLVEDRRTMSNFIREISKRADLDTSFETLLKQLLDDRNLFIHRLRFQPWFSTETQEGRAATWEFMAKLQGEIQVVTMTIQAAMFTSLDLGGIMTEKEKEQLSETGFLAEIKEYQAILKEVISKKDPN